MVVAIAFFAIAITMHWRSDAAPHKASQSTSTIESSRLAKANEPSATPSKKPSRAKTKTAGGNSKAAITPSSSGRLVIGTLGINARVVPISAPKGVLMPPNNPQTLGWWKDGAAPGAAQGSALITGHTVHTGGGALNSLDKASAGEKVTFVGDGEKLTYRVQSVKTYHKQKLAQDAARLFSQSVPGRLVIITCEDWTGSEYLSNVVVTAAPA